MYDPYWLFFRNHLIELQFSCQEIFIIEEKVYYGPSTKCIANLALLSEVRFYLIFRFTLYFYTCPYKRMKQTAVNIPTILVPEVW